MKFKICGKEKTDKEAQRKLKEAKTDQEKGKHKEYRYLRTKLFVQILIMMVIGVWAIFVIYDLFLQGRFANWVVFSFKMFLEWIMMLRLKCTGSYFAIILEITLLAGWQPFF